MLLSNSMRISRPRTPQTHDAAMIIHEHIPEIFSPHYTDAAAQPHYTTYYNPNPLGLFMEEQGVPFPTSLPSRMDVQDAPPATRLRVEYNVEGGWQPDGFGGHRYQEYGRVEDVSNSNCRLKNSKSDSEAPPMAPEDYDGPFTITSPLPPTTTPPPAPTFRGRRFEIPDLDYMGNLVSAPDQNWRTMPYPKPSSLEPSRVGSPTVDQPPTSNTPPLRNINTTLPNPHLHHPLFYSSRNPRHVGTLPVDRPPTPLGNIPASQNMNRHSFEVHSPVRERPTRPLPLSPLHVNRQLDDHHELTVLQSNRRLIKTAAGSVDTISWIFQDARNPEDIRPQLAVDMCGRIKAILSALTATLDRRDRFTEEHWKLQSQAWRQKYSDRLLSLRRTLQRLSSLEDRLKGTRPKLKAINKALEKLRQFEYKLSDLNLGFNKLFDRLRTRQLHAMLTDSISEEEQMRKSDFSSVEAYKIKRTEGKAARARLRRDYLVYRTGHRLSLVK